MSVAQQPSQSLLDIANSYDGKTVYFQYNSPLYADYQNRIVFFENTNSLLINSTDDDRLTPLWGNLTRFTQNILSLEKSCKPFAWDFSFAQYPVLDFSNALPYIPDLNSFNTNVDNSMKMAHEGLVALVERFQLGATENLIPPAQSLDSLFNVLDAPQSDNKLGLTNFLQNLTPQSCSYCGSIDTQMLLKKYTDVVEQAHIEASNKFKQYYSLATDLTSPLPVPTPLQKDCFDTVLKGIYSDLNRQMILRKGEAELLRAEKSMLDLMLDLGFQLAPPMSIPAFIEATFTTMASQNAYQLKTVDDYTKAYDEIRKRIEVKLPEITHFAHNFPLSYHILLDSSQAKSGWYSFDPQKQQGSFTTTADPSNGYLTFELPVLFFHEGIPGHHLQQSINSTSAAQATNEFDKVKDFSAEIEGWGLYTEELALDLGLYLNPEEKLGFFDLLRLRALRLTNAYHFYYDSWTDEQATAFTNEHLFGNEIIAKESIERPKLWNGQAVGYMVGKTILQSLKNSALLLLGSKCFNLPEFHDTFLLLGNTHLDTVVTQTSLWIKNNQCYKGKLTSQQIEQQLRADILTQF